MVKGNIRIGHRGTFGIGTFRCSGLLCDDALSFYKIGKDGIDKLSDVKWEMKAGNKHATVRISRDNSLFLVDSIKRSVEVFKLNLEIIIPGQEWSNFEVME
jgi:hypothetical protein